MIRVHWERMQKPSAHVCLHVRGNCHAACGVRMDVAAEAGPPAKVTLGSDDAATIENT